MPWYKEVKKPTWTEPDWPVNYKVPNFGVDTDIINTKNSISQSEKTHKKNFNADFKATEAKVNPRGYTVPDFGVDRDILWTRGSIKHAENKLNHHTWNPIDVEKK